ncbi:Smr-domain-containing protein [Armillaria gallica]|uniref:Smr-domain-containing protein n=1 Tax=Armillaria gallica TaxID=47427 RepID=A0A2H3DHH6_ARMGA|nr:Smr-domain-containing protein [Armillaria gallica]
MSIRLMFIWMGVLGATVLLTIAYKVFWAKSSRSRHDTLPVYRPEQHQPIYQPPPRPAPPSQSYRPSPHTPLLHQPEHRPVYQPPPRPPPPPPPSPYTPPVHQPEQHRPVYQPPPSPPLPSQSSSYRPPSPHGLPTHEDANQQDHPNEYTGFRVRATKEKDEEKRCLNESRKAYIHGDHAAAKDLSKQAKNHRKKMEQLNKEASNRVYLENNRNRKPGKIDLHGLHVKEAIAHTDAALKEAKRRGDSEIRIIVGKGLHSEGGEARIKPAIMALMRKCRLVAELDPSNSGILIVKFNGRPHLNISRHHSSGRHRGRRASNIGACA